MATGIFGKASLAHVLNAPSVDLSHVSDYTRAVSVGTSFGIPISFIYLTIMLTREGASCLPTCSMVRCCSPRAIRATPLILVISGRAKVVVRSADGRGADADDRPAQRHVRGRSASLTVARSRRTARPSRTAVCSSCRSSRVPALGAGSFAAANPQSKVRCRGDQQKEPRPPRADHGRGGYLRHRRRPDPAPHHRHLYAAESALRDVAVLHDASFLFSTSHTRLSTAQQGSQSLAVSEGAM
jgi:hypothetical protein